jgi:hypothetical protein
MTPKNRKASLKWLRWHIDNRRQLMASYEDQYSRGNIGMHVIRRLQSEIDMIEGILGAVGNSPRK